MLGELLLTTGIALIAYAFYVFSTRSAKYFEERNLKYVGIWPAVKGLGKIILGKTDILTMVKEMYDVFPDVP